MYEMKVLLAITSGTGQNEVTAIPPEIVMAAMKFTVVVLRAAVVPCESDTVVLAMPVT
jgi:hypothetical protein